MTTDTRPALPSHAEIPSPRSGPADAASPSAAPQPSAEVDGRASDLVWLLPTALALALGAYQLGRPLMWNDEMATWSAARRSFGELIKLVGNVDVVMWPYYLLMHTWTALFGDSEVVLRIPGLVCMTAATTMTALLARRQFGPRAGLTAGLLFAVAPTTARYSQEVRPYPIGVFFVVTATFLLFRALDSPNQRRWMQYGLAVCAAGLTHLFCLGVLVGHALVVWRRGAAKAGVADWFRAGPARAWLMSVGLALLPIAPLVLLSVRQTAQINWIGPVHWDTLVQLPYGIFFSETFGWFVVSVALVAGASSRSHRSSADAVLMIALIPAVSLFVVSILHPVWVPRYLLYTTPMWCVAAGAAVVALSRLRMAVLLGIGAALALPAQAWIHQPGSHGQVDMHAVASILSTTHQPGDGIIYGATDHDDLMRQTVEYYVPPAARPRDVLELHSYREVGGFASVECSDPEPCLESVPRVWVLLRYATDRPLDGLWASVRPSVESAFVESGHWPVVGGTLALFTRQPSTTGPGEAANRPTPGLRF